MTKQTPNTPPQTELPQKAPGGASATRRRQPGSGPPLSAPREQPPSYADIPDLLDYAQALRDWIFRIRLYLKHYQHLNSAT